jgi:hypothetical protein
MSRPQLLLQVFGAIRSCNTGLASTINVHLLMQPNMLVVLRGADAVRMAKLRQVFERCGWDLLQFDQRVIPMPEPNKLRRLAVSICGAGVNAAAAAVDCGGGDRATALLAVAAERIRRIGACGDVNDPLLAVVAADLCALGGARYCIRAEFARALDTGPCQGRVHRRRGVEHNRTLQQFI